MSPKTGTRVVGYTRVSTQEQAESGLGLADQHSAIEAACERRGWDLVAILDDKGLSGKSTAGRKGLQAAISMIEAGAADALVVAKLDRLSRSLIDFTELMAQAQKNGWAIVLLDNDFDMTTPTGRLTAHMLASFAQFEREIIGQRTKAALAEKKRQPGVRLGRAPGVPEAVVARIRRERAAGASLTAIAAGLTGEKVATAQRRRPDAAWYASTVRHVLQSSGGDPLKA